jgi:peptidoglycan/xylan/chitin deacetylase (PgdA/CDA1 family)
VAGVTGVLAAGIHGALHRNSPVFGRVLSRLPTKDRKVALTFDDGPNPDATPSILDTLAAHGVRATFFALGRHVERWPELVRRAADEGHTIANHGFHHRKLHVMPPRFVRDDIRLGTERIEAATGKRPGFFRAPHGFRNPWVTRAANRYGQRVVGWTLGVWDSDKPGAKVIARRAVDGSGPGTILLLHDGDGYDANGDRMQTAAALPEIISGLRARGYEFVLLT